MPAPTVASTPTPTVTSTRAGTSESRDAGTTDGHFGRQLDAARQNQPGKSAKADSTDPAGAKHATDARQPGAAEPVEAVEQVAVTVPGLGDVVKSVLGATGAVADKAVDDADRTLTDSAPQGVFAMFAPLLGGALPAPGASAGGVAGGRLLTAQALGGGAINVAADAANAARMAALLKAGDASLQSADATPAGLVQNPIGWSAVLDAVQPHAADDVQTTVTPSAGISPSALSPLAGAGMPVVAVAAPVGTPAFGQEFGQQVTWLATQDLKQARIRLHPDELGQVDLKISMNDGRVDVAFNVQHPGAAQAVQQSLPQLDQMLAQHGLSLGHTEVGQHGSDGSSSQRHGSDTAEVEDIGELHAVTSRVALRPASLLDAFA